MRQRLELSEEIRSPTSQRSEYTITIESGGTIRIRNTINGAAYYMSEVTIYEQDWDKVWTTVNHLRSQHAARKAVLGTIPE